MSEQRGRVRVEQGRKRVRALVDGRVAADTTAPRYVWEVPYYPAYYLPREDIAAELVDTGATKHSPSRGDAHVLDLSIGGSHRPAGALAYVDSPIEELRGLVKIEWDAVDEWLEEDEPIYTHPRDPYTRVDILGSSRHIRVSVDGVLVADSRQPRILFETGLPPRYYLPMTDVRTDLLRPSDEVSHCPYKGTAGYWDVVLPTPESGEPVVHAGLVWGYRAPLPESQKIAGLVCFYNEKVELEIDGVTQDRPHTKFS